MLVIESIHRMSWLQHSTTGYAFDNRLLDLRPRLFLIQLIFKLLNFGDSVLKKNDERSIFRRNC